MIRPYSFSKGLCSNYAGHSISINSGLCSDQTTSRFWMSFRTLSQVGLIRAGLDRATLPWTPLTPTPSPPPSPATLASFGGVILIIISVDSGCTLRCEAEHNKQQMEQHRIQMEQHRMEMEAHFCAMKQHLSQVPLNYIT